MSERSKRCFRKEGNLPKPKSQDRLAQMGEIFGGEEKPIRDMDSELVEKVQTIDELKADGESRLLEERAKEDELIGSSEDEFLRMDENTQQLFDRLKPVVDEYEDFFERRARSLHATGHVEHVGLPFSGKYEVNDFAKDKESGKKYRYRFHYHIEGRGDDKRYVPDRYEQILAAKEEDAAITDYDKQMSHGFTPRLQIEFGDGKIDSVNVIYYVNAHKHKDPGIARLAPEGSLRGIVSNLSARDMLYHGKYGFNQWIRASFVFKQEEKDVVLLSREQRYWSSKHNGLKNTQRTYAFNALDNTFEADYVEDMGKKEFPSLPQISAHQYTEAFGEVFGLIPTKVLNGSKKEPGDYEHIT